MNTVISDEYKWRTRGRIDAFKAALDNLFAAHPTDDPIAISCRASAHIPIWSFYGVWKFAIRAGIPRKELDAVVILLLDASDLHGLYFENPL